VALYAASVPRRRAMHAWGWLALCVGFSILPDFDFVVPAAAGRIDWAHTMHRSLTHTVFFAVGVALVWFVVARIVKPHSRAARVGVAAMIFAALVAHIALDVMNEDTKTPYGVSIFWPVWDKSFYAPIGVLPRIEKLTYADIVSVHNVGVALTELGLFGGLILVVVGVRLAVERLRARKQPAGPAVEPEGHIS